VLGYLHSASRRIIDLLVEEGIGVLVLGKNPFWKTGVELGKKHNQEFVQIPHAQFLELLTYKAEASGIRVLVTEESYTSRASFLDLDPLPTYDPAQGAEQEEQPRFSGRRDGRWYRVKGRAPMHADVNGSFNIGRKVFPTAFGRGDSGHRSSAQTACSSQTRESWQLCHDFWILLRLALALAPLCRQAPSRSGSGLDVRALLI
jgi:putative transposase